MLEAEGAVVELDVAGTWDGAKEFLRALMKSSRVLGCVAAGCADGATDGALGAATGAAVCVRGCVVFAGAGAC